MNESLTNDTNHEMRLLLVKVKDCDEPLVIPLQLVSILGHVRQLLDPILDIRGLGK